MKVTVAIDGDVYICKKQETPEPLPMKIFSQRDPRWRYDKMGGTSQTIGGAGCALCCAAMVASQDKWLSTTPKWLNGQNPYYIVNGNEAHLAWDQLPNFYPSTVWIPAHRKTWVRRLSAAELELVIDIMKQSPLIIYVDFNPGGLFDSHFVVGLRYIEKDQDILIADPWDGVETQLLRRYAKTGEDLNDVIWGIRGFYKA